MPQGVEVDENLDGLTIRARENVLVAPRHMRWLRPLVRFGGMIALVAMLTTGGAVAIGVSVPSAPAAVLGLGLASFLVFALLAIASLVPVVLLLWTLYRLDNDATWVDITVGTQGVVLARPGRGTDIVFPPHADLHVSVENTYAFPCLVLADAGRREVVPVFGRRAAVDWMASAIQERIAKAGTRDAVPEALRKVQGAGQAT